jgi:protein-L-isoaspartate(D-aspartate) O-methyltransferase
MDQETELRIIRRAYAKQITAGAAVGDPRVEDAFAETRREAFLGPGPWPIAQWDGRYRMTPSADPTYLYTDELIGILPEKRLNNGQPRLHAALVAAAAPKEGDHVLHVGAGLGYYTAILAHLAGASGRVTAVEFLPDLAARAAANLADRPTVRVVQGDGSTVAFEPADVIYVNAGATRPADAWLDRLADGGRLILPLTADLNFTPHTSPHDLLQMTRRGAVFRIERRGDEYLAREISPVAIFPCEGSRDEVSERALAAGFEAGGWQKVTRLYRHQELPSEQCWVQAPGWSLAYE